MPFLSEPELKAFDFASIGERVLIDDSVQIINAAKIRIGDNVRIDAFSILSAGDAGIELGSHIHIGAGTYLFGGGGLIKFHDFAGTSPGVRIFTATDDFTDGFLRGPQIDISFRKVTNGTVELFENAIIGANSVILPSVSIGKNASAGALSVVTKDISENLLVSGNPARFVSRRDGEKSDALIEQARHLWHSRKREYLNRNVDNMHE